MPVSKKRKKEGKPVKRTPAQGTGSEEEAAARPEAGRNPMQQRMGKPANPFISNQQSRRGAQRGR